MNVLVCDLGNVVAFFDHHRACRQLAALNGARLTAEEVFRDVFSGTLERDFDCGRLPAGDFLGTLRARLKTTASDEAIARAWCDIFEPNHELVEILVRLKAAGTRLVLASNTNVLHYEWIEHHYHELLASFDDAVLSFRLGCRKPEQRFFDECVRCAGVPADVCVYVDDRKDFVEAARSAGMRGVVYRSATVASEIEREILNPKS